MKNYEFPKEILNAHQKYLVGHSFLLRNNPLSALNYFNQSQELFINAIDKNSQSSTQKLWEFQLSIINETIDGLKFSQKDHIHPINMNNSSMNRNDDLISKIRIKYEKKEYQPKTIGLKLAKKVLNQIVTVPLERKDIWMLSNKPPLSTLFFGPPGCGKSLLTIDKVKESGLSLYNITPGNISSKWFGETEKNIERVFQNAYAEPEGCIILFDEFDAIAGKVQSESEAMMRLRKALLTALDGYRYENKDNVKQVRVIATTNRPDRLEGAMMRRFDRRVYIPPPDKVTIQQLISNITHRAGVNLEFHSKENIQLVQAMLGLTANEITNIVHGAIWETADAILDNNEQAESLLRKKILSLRADLTPYFCTFEALEPSTFRFLDQQFGFPKTNEPAYSWEPVLLQEKYRLERLHPKPKIIQKRKLLRQI